MLFLLLAALISMPECGDQTPPFAGTISGMVSVFPLDEPLPGATVYAYEIILKPNSDSIEIKPPKAALTDAQGKYRFESLPTGHFLLRARVPCFHESRRWDVWVVTGSNSVADLFIQVADLADYAPGKAPDAGSISGLVYSLANKPIADILITAFSVETMGPVFQTRTNKKGEFNLDVIARGHYVLIYSNADYGFNSKVVEVNGKKQVRLTLTQ